MVKLSILLLTYNHELYVAEALDSILMQKVDFEYEVIVLEDGSTDKTREIILKYKDRFKNIRLCFHKKNYGMAFNHVMGFKQAKAEYWCLLDGDDYWTDPEKLQLQIDFLDKNPDFVGSAHEIVVFQENSTFKVKQPEGGTMKSVCTAEDLIGKHQHFHTSSYVWRNVFNGNFPKEFLYSRTIVKDTFIAIFHALQGKIQYMDRNMSCYRLTGKGIFSGLRAHQFKLWEIYSWYACNKALKGQYTEGFNHMIGWWCSDFVKTAPKNYKTFLLRVKVFILWLSLDDKKRQRFQKIAGNIENLLNRKANQGSVSFKSYKLFLTVCLRLVKTADKLCQKSKIIDKLFQSFFGFLFSCLHLFNINRYWLYYRIEIYQFLKINIYEDVEKLTEA